MRVWIASAVLASVAAPAQASCEAQSGADVAPLVELYTSEGCSSCPPADQWLSRLALADTSDVNFLAFHVDYWEGDGWHDRFGSSAFSKRQRQRVDAAGRRVGLLGGQGAVFTPQVMVGRAVAAAWSEPKKFVPVLRAAQTQAGANLSLNASPAAGGAWTATVQGAAVGEAPAGAQLWLAQYLDGQTTEVHAGENKGVTLHHDHVVSKLWGPWPLEGAKSETQQVSFEMPSSPWGLTAFVQDRRGNILQSLQLTSAKCTASG
jgi:hypothetical protein